MLPYKDALLNLADTNVSYKTKKRIPLQEDGDFFFKFPAVTKLRVFDAIKEEMKL